MSHFAKVKAGIVQTVIVADQGFVDKLPSEEGVFWVQTSYNTKGGVHYGQDGNPDGGVALRKNYAGQGMTYDSTRDAFYASQPYPSWTLNEDSCIWEPPVDYPAFDPSKIYSWDEENTRWVLDSGE
mgnify:FL=1|tara:strand:- start:582 stop:959 length:378 start_codon:yes stop_codon:yes gene_type:complete